MTVTGSGAITFSNIMNEFNSGGGQSNIKLGDYIGTVSYTHLRAHET